MAIAKEQHRLSWHKKVESQKASGLTIAGWCKEHNEHPHNFHYWKKVFAAQKSQEPKAKFTEIKSTLSPGIHFECAGVNLQVATDFNPSTLRRCLQILRELQC